MCECHATYGAHLRAKRFTVGYARSHLGSDFSREKRFQRDLDAYQAARRQGVQPDGTSRRQVEHALDVSDRTGIPYGVRKQQV